MTQACTNNPLLVDVAFTLNLKFDQLNEAFAEVHKAISHTTPIDEQSVASIQAQIDNYMSTYRRHTYSITNLLYGRICRRNYIDRQTLLPWFY